MCEFGDKINMVTAGVSQHVFEYLVALMVADDICEFIMLYSKPDRILIQLACTGMVFAQSDYLL